MRLRRTHFLLAFIALGFRATALSQETYERFTTVIDGIRSDYLLTPATGSFSGYLLFGNAIAVTYTAPVGTYLYLNNVFAGSAQAPLQVGSYSNATRWPFNGDAPGISVIGVCNQTIGNFTISELKYSSRLDSLRVMFREQCVDPPASIGWTISGELAFNASPVLIPAVPASSPSATLCLALLIALAGARMLRGAA